MSKPFSFNSDIATVLANICCHNNYLPQGAPTSPVISNMIAWKLDAELEQLSKRSNGTYSRYADDITFSFTCKKEKLPHDILIAEEETVILGKTLNDIIHQNGFKINYSKVRLRGKNSRMEVTGLTVNESLNVPRKYIRQISSMLYSIEKFGINKAEEEYFRKYYVQKHKDEGLFPHLFIKIVHGKLARRFNEVNSDLRPFKLPDIELTKDQKRTTQLIQYG